MMASFVLLFTLLGIIGPNQIDTIVVYGKDVVNFATIDPSFTFSMKFSSRPLRLPPDGKALVNIYLESCNRVPVYNRSIFQQGSVTARSTDNILREYMLPNSSLSINLQTENLVSNIQCPVRVTVHNNTKLLNSEVYRNICISNSSQEKFVFDKSSYYLLSMSSEVDINYTITGDAYYYNVTDLTFVCSISDSEYSCKMSQYEIQDRLSDTNTDACLFISEDISEENKIKLTTLSSQGSHFFVNLFIGLLTSSICLIMISILFLPLAYTNSCCLICSSCTIIS